MIEIIIKGFMEDQLSVPLYFEFPDNPPTSFVVLKKSDSGRENYLDSAVLVADSYGPTLLAAAQLNEQVKGILDDLIRIDAVSSSRRAGDYPVFDTKNKKHRYQAVQNITYY